MNSLGSPLRAARASQGAMRADRKGSPLPRGLWPHPLKGAMRADRRSRIRRILDLRVLAARGAMGG
ncbi:hypothetical protein GCM10023144_08470 [Pigmentiphaga soli]|uniref:Uncharacterized protein n=1 Tax=Pigmentiphaga soli TaxID=1007095 RepID=A0ABP8GKS8_9BURK